MVQARPAQVAALQSAERGAAGAGHPRALIRAAGRLPIALLLLRRNRLYASVTFKPYGLYFNDTHRAHYELRYFTSYTLTKSTVSWALGPGCRAPHLMLRPTRSAELFNIFYDRKTFSFCTLFDDSDCAAPSAERKHFSCDRLAAWTLHAAAKTFRHSPRPPRQLAPRVLFSRKAMP